MVEWLPFDKLRDRFVAENSETLRQAQYPSSNIRFPWTFNISNPSNFFKQFQHLRKKYQNYATATAVMAQTSTAAAARSFTFLIFSCF